MGKLIGGFLVGLFVGLLFGPTIFPEGFSAAVQQLIPGR